MPELPNVEVLRRELIAKKLIGCVISGIDLMWPMAVTNPTVELFLAEISGLFVGDIRRRGKYLLFDLEGRLYRTLIVHLRMTGSLEVVGYGNRRPAYTRNVLIFNYDLELCFVDPRKLGTLSLTDGTDEKLSKLGPEPLSAELNPQVLAEQFSRRAVPVKALLCDQSIIAGIGNIYADEVLFKARIRPTKLGKEISVQENRRLYRAIVSSLNEAVEHLSMTISKETTSSRKADDLHILKIRRSEGEPCNSCTAPIKRVTVRGRSSYFCSRCQER